LEKRMKGQMREKFTCFRTHDLKMNKKEPSKLAGEKFGTNSEDFEGESY